MASVETTPEWDRALAALERGDADAVRAHIDRAVERWRSLQDYSVNWVASLLSFIGREMGEEAVERALREFGATFLADRRSSDVPWEELPAEVRARVITRAMVANAGTCEVDEDDEKIILSFRCGTGGRLIDEGRYEGPGAYLTLHGPAGRTFMRDELPVYCAHCPVNNEMQPVEAGGVPYSVEYPPERPGDPCIHHVYKDARALPAEVYLRIGHPPPPTP